MNKKAEGVTKPLPPLQLKTVYSILVSYNYAACSAFAVSLHCIYINT